MKNRETFYNALARCIDYIIESGNENLKMNRAILIIVILNTIISLFSLSISIFSE